MTDKAMKADDHEPDYRKAMLFHSDRADQYAAERDSAIAEAATLRAEVERLRGALQWCSGSDDFQEGGKAREGWLKLCAPLLHGEGKA